MKVEIPDKVTSWKAMLDRLYKNCKKDKLSRFSIEWGKPSTEMNLQLKLILDESVLYKYLFIYWSMLSHLLDIHHHFPSPLRRIGVKRKQAEKVNEIAHILKTGIINDTDRETQKILGARNYR